MIFLRAWHEYINYSKFGPEVKIGPFEKWSESDQWSEFGPQWQPCMMKQLIQP